MDRNLRTKYELVLTADGRLLVKTAEGFEDIGDQADRAESKVDRLNKRLQKTASRADKLASGAGAFSRFTATIATGLGALTYRAVDAASEFEAAHTKLLTTFQGNAERASEMMSWIEEFAAGTPFELKGITDAAIQLENFYLDARRWLPLVGDLAAAMGRDVRETAVAVGKAVASGGSGMDALRESYAITSQQLKRLGWNGKTGAEGVESFAAALERALKEGKTAGGMERLSKSFKGVVSNIQDMLYQLSAEVGAPLLEIIKEDLNGILERVEEMKRTGEWDAWVKRLADGFKQFYEGAKKTLTWVGKLVKKLVEFLDKNPEFAEFLTKLATIGPLAGKATQGVARLAGGVMRLASHILKATGPSGALSKLGGWAMRTSGAVSAVDPSKATGAAGSSAVGRAGSAKGSMVGTGLAVTAAFAVAGVAIRGIIKAVDDLVVSEEELARGRAASDELNQTLIGIQQRQAQREIEYNRTVAEAHASISGHLEEEVEHVAETAEQEERRLAAMQHQAEIQGNISSARADLQTALGQMRSTLEGDFWGHNLGVHVQMTTGQSIDDLMTDIERMSKTGDVAGIQSLREELSSVESIVGSDEWPQLAEYLNQAALAGEQLRDAMYNAGKESEWIVELNKTAADHQNRYTALMDQTAQLSGAERDNMNEKLEAVRTTLKAQKSVLQANIQELDIIKQQLIALAEKAKAQYDAAVAQGFGEAAATWSKVEIGYRERAEEITGQIGGLADAVDTVDETLAYQPEPITTERGEAASGSGGSSGGSSGGVKGPAIQYVNNYYTSHINEVLLDAPEEATERALVITLSRMAEQGPVTVEEGG